MYVHYRFRFSLLEDRSNNAVTVLACIWWSVRVCGVLSLMNYKMTDDISAKYFPQAYDRRPQDWTGSLAEMYDFFRLDLLTNEGVIAGYASYIVLSCEHISSMHIRIEECRSSVCR